MVAVAKTKAQRLSWWIGLGLGLLVVGAGGCLTSELSNSFDLKGPKGLLGYVGGYINEFACRFDQGKFEDCWFGF